MPWLHLRKPQIALVALTSRDWMSAIEGLAGTAKTYTIGAVREFAEAHGYIVRAFAMTSNAVKELRKVGFDACTVASLTSNPLPQTDKPQLWFMDESSLLATRPVNELLKIAGQEGITLVRTVGDQRQHLAIQAGHPMRQFLDDGMPVAELKRILRQQDPELREAVAQASQGKAGAAARTIDLLDEQGRLNEIADPKERYQCVAQNYIRGHEAGQQTLVVSPGNDERRDLNRLIRDALVERGHVEARGRTHGILVPRQDMTRSKIAHAILRRRRCHPLRLGPQAPSHRQRFISHGAEHRRRWQPADSFICEWPHDRGQPRPLGQSRADIQTGTAGDRRRRSSRISDP
jgi:hypothetical protein